MPALVRSPLSRPPRPHDQHLLIQMTGHLQLADEPKNLEKPGEMSYDVSVAKKKVTSKVFHTFLLRRCRVLEDVLKLRQGMKMRMFAYPQDARSKQTHPFHPLPLPQLLGPLAKNALRCRNALEKRV